MAVQAKLVADSRLKEVARVRHWLMEHARTEGFSDEVIGNLVLVVSEACTNVIKHAYANQAGCPIELHLAIDDAKLELSIRDIGTEFDLQACALPDLSQPLEGGYG